MRIFLDTNVLLDVYLKRAGEPGSARVIAACGEPWNQGYVAVHTLANPFYLIERQRTRVEAWEFIRDVLWRGRLWRKSGRWMQPARSRWE